jgi:hypothetical protein
MTVESIADFERQTEVGRMLLDRGREQGLEQGRKHGHVQTLEALTRGRFGDRPDIPQLAKRLARSCDLPTAVHPITHTTRFEDLLE